jgi:hypothetical protein
VLSIHHHHNLQAGEIDICCPPASTNHVCLCDPVWDLPPQFCQHFVEVLFMLAWAYAPLGGAAHTAQQGILPVPLIVLMQWMC